MRLAKLTVSGFKSFADKTEFRFDEPVIGIVGPNGCGKSNVVDAIKWVLGERSAKSLRGKEMIDVIFSGSAGRKPSGMASVTLTFRNPLLTPEQIEARRSGRAPGDDAPGDEDSIEAELLDERSPLDHVAGSRRWLPIDSETVDVERRLYRDGTSEYLINSKRARLRDIRDLFLDTGIGADAYSIIEQGKVDAMILSNAKDRRSFFEEAAGVARFKTRRIEAIRKLDRAENNLIRVREQLESTERRLRIVRSQANKARRFRQIDTDLRAWKAAHFFDQYDDLCVRLIGLTSQLQDLEHKRREAHREVESLEEARQDAELRRHDLAEEQRSCERRRAEADQRRRGADERREMTLRLEAEGREQLRLDEQRREDIEQRLVALQKQIEEHARLAEALEQEAREAEENLQRAASQRESV